MTTAPDNQDSRLSFEPKEHTYAIDKKPADGVTSVLEENGLIDTRFFTDEDRYRGTYVHAATVLVDENDLDWSKVPKEFVGYIRSWERFKLKTGLIVLESEQRVYDPVFMVAGTLDRIVRMNAFNIPMVLDIKTISGGKGKPLPHVALQISAYESMHRREHGGDMMLRGAVVLQEDGSVPRLYQYTDFSDSAEFYSLLSSTQTRRTHKRANTIRTD